jgi:hypothetical protein
MNRTGSARVGRGIVCAPLAVHLAWTLWALQIALALAAAALVLMSPSGPNGAPGVLSALLPVLDLAYPTVGALVVSRHPTHPVGWLLCLAGLMGIAAASGLGYATFALSAAPPLPGAALAAWLAGWIADPRFFLVGTLLPLIFPWGRLPSPRWRPVVWLSAAGAVGTVLNDAFTPGPLRVMPAIENPFPLGGAGDAVAVVKLLYYLLPVCWVAAGVGFFRQFRRARGAVRQQFKWLASAFALLALAFCNIIFSAATQWYANTVAVVPLRFAYAGIAVATGIAILRYRLYDVDVVINRALVYGALTVGLGSVYWGTVAVLGQLLRPLTQGSELATIVSTLAVAALFQPLRRRVQDAVDRRFYRRRYDAQQTIEAFGARMRQHVDLDTLSAQLLSVVCRTMQPERASLWLRPGLRADRTGPRRATGGREAE